MITTTFIAGAPSWLDLGSADVERSTAFYTGVFAWQAVSAGPEYGGYGFFELDGQMVGGYGPLMDPAATGAWMPYFGTTDAEASVKAVEQAGGTVRAPAMDVMAFGRMAQLSDVTGGQFAVWQPGENSGFKVASVPGSLSWVELHTTDGPAAMEFYRSALNWEIDTQEMGEGMVYHVLNPAGSSESFGGIMAMEGLPSVLWRPYFEVADCDATVAKAVGLGATVMMPAQTMPGVGRMAELVDPLGTRFCVITGEAPQS